MKVTPDFQLTPEIAREFLELNTGNRRVNRTRVRALASAMERGEFYNNGDTIRIGKDGRLYDGQHRNYAVIESGVTITVILVEDLEPEALPTIDQGRARTSSDILKMVGAEGSSAEVSLARVIMDHDGLVSRYSDATPILVSEYVRDHYSDLHLPASIGKGAGHRLRNTGAKGTSQASLGFAVYKIVEPGNDVHDVERWLYRVCENDGLAKGTPEYALSVYLHNDNLARSGAVNRALRTRQVEPIIRAWNASVNGSRMSVLRMKDATELPIAEVR